MTFLEVLRLVISERGISMSKRFRLLRLLLELYLLQARVKILELTSEVRQYLHPVL